MGDDGGDLLPGDPVRLGVLQMVGQGRIRDPGGHQRHDRDDAPGFDVDGPFVPYLSEEHVVVEMGERGSKFSQLVSACGLNDLFSHIRSPYLK